MSKNSSLGVSVVRTKMTALAVAAALASLGGANKSFADAIVVQEQPDQQAQHQPAKAKKSAIEQIVVTAQHTSGQQARQVQKQAPNLVVVQTVKEIEKLPDTTLAEAVRRMPGVSLETDEGEGRYVNIRGFDADLNSTTFDGVHLLPTNNASPFGGYRALALDSVPLGFIGAITLSNSNMPSQDAQALGGTIDITPTAVPRDGKPFIEGTLGAGYEPLRNTPVSNYSLTGGGKFGDFSVVANVMRHIDSRGIDDSEAAYFNDATHPYTARSNIEQRDYELHRNRHGYGLNIDYTPNGTSDYFLRAFETGYTEDYHRQFMDINPSGNATADANGSINDTLSFPGGIQRSLRDEQETSTERLVMLGGKNTLNGGQKLDYHVAFVTGTYQKPFDYNSTFNYMPPDGTTAGAINYCNCGAGHTPIYGITGAPGYLDPANYTLASFANSTALNYDKEQSFGANYKMPTSLTSARDESLKFGLSTRLRHKVTSAQPYSYPNLPTLPMTSAVSGGQETYYNGQYQNGVDIAPGNLQSVLGPGSIASGDITSALQQYLDAHENIYASYAQYQGVFGQLGVLGGVRVERTEDRASAYSAGNDANGNPFAIPINNQHGYSNFFPSLQLRYALRPNTIVRAAYSSTIARPGFNQSNPALAIDVGSGIVTTGNPALKPATANSFDLDFEQYLPGGGIFSVGLFDKQISNYIVPVTSNQTLANNGLYPGSTQPFTEYTFKNVSSSYARGFQVNWGQHFTTLPGIWKGLGTNVNYTFVDSQVQIRPGEYSTLPSTSRNIWNLALLYDYGPVSLDLAAYYVSADLFAVGSNRSSDVYNASRTNLDFGASYALSKNVAVHFYAKDLLDTPHTFYEGSSDRPIQREFYGRTYLAEVSFKL